MGCTLARRANFEGPFLEVPTCSFTCVPTYLLGRLGLVRTQVPFQSCLVVVY